MVGVQLLRTGKKECQGKDWLKFVTYLLVKATVTGLFSEKRIRLVRLKGSLGVQALIWLSNQYLKFSFGD